MSRVLIGAAVVVLLLAGLLVGSAQSLRARRRLLAARAGLTLFVIGLVVLGFATGIEFNLSQSDNLAIAGLLLSAATGVGASVIDRTFSRMTVAIVIPSRVAFHADLRRGLRDGLADAKVKYVDVFADRGSVENLSDFAFCFRKALQQVPDYLVIASPDNAFVDEARFREDVDRIVRLGGRVFFIENCPAQFSKRTQEGIAVIRSDSTAGAVVLAHYVADVWDRRSAIAILAGPKDSHPARTRLKVLREQVRVPENLIVQTDVPGWSQTNAYEYTKDVLTKDNGIGLVICGNDSMAIGACRAIREARLDDKVRVIGYDGVPRAIYAIAEPRSCLSATIRIPPAQYGLEIASQIVEDGHTFGFRRYRVASVTIPISEANLVTSHNVEQIIAD